MVVNKKKNSSNDIRGDVVPVLCVLKKDARLAKQALEQIQALDKRYRMKESIHHSNCIAIPIIILPKDEESQPNENKDDLNDDEDPNNHVIRTVKDWKQNYEWSWIQHVHRQLCPYSTKVLGNHPYSTSSNGHSSNDTSKSNHGNMDDGWLQGLNAGQQALYHVLKTLAQRERQLSQQDTTLLQTDIQSFDTSICPKKLEIFGDDRTVVLTPTAFPLATVDQLLQAHVMNTDCDGGDTSNHLESLRRDFWKELALMHKSQRIARRGTIDPESKIRESGHRLIWPNSGIPDETGPGSPGWIKVTEQGIGQSFDMCRVMFSRGNISEKIRFGKLVQEGERLLDMYAGIGYYTLPALVIGKAAHVVACEWNEHAVKALQFNVQDNKITSDRVTILQGDCRVSAKEHLLVNQFDRISLGLLPSAEGGWRTAVRALGPNGGWLHIHANVPVTEVEDWSMWMTRELWNLVTKERSDKLQPNESKWMVLCHHVEKVKSFAPTVAHYVADVYVGRSTMLETLIANYESLDIPSMTAAVLQDGALVPCPETIQPPSCALSPDGVLSQAWMR